MTQRKIALSIEEAADYTGIGRNTLRPVSYTHLDVYKRQLYEFPIVYVERTDAYPACPFLSNPTNTQLCLSFS